MDIVGLATLVEMSILAHPGKAAQARERPSLRGWFTARIMQMTNGEIEHRIVDGMVDTAFHMESEA